MGSNTRQTGRRFPRDWAGTATGRRLLSLALAAVLGGCAGTDLTPAARAARLASDADVATVLLFVRTDCPISNRYAPEVNRLRARFHPAGVRFTLVYPNPDVTAEQIRQHRREFGHEIPARHDPDHRLVARTGVTITPEAAVYDRRGRLVYRGRIDDRFVEFGVTRRQPTTHDLEEVLQTLAQGEDIEPRTTEAVGCFIADLQ